MYEQECPKLADDCRQAILKLQKEGIPLFKIGKMLANPERPKGYSKTSLSMILNSEYPADLSKVEAAIRLNLMNETLTCPELGEITKKACLSNQSEALKTGSTNPMKTRIKFACRRCDKAQLIKKGE